MSAIELKGFVLIPLPKDGDYLLSAMGADGNTYYLDLHVAPYAWRKLNREGVIVYDRTQEC